MILKFASALVFTFALSGSHPAGVAIHSGEDFDLADFKWKKRVLLVFAPDSQSEFYTSQLRLLENKNSEAKERDLVVISLFALEPSYFDGFEIDSNTVAYLRKDFRIKKNEFAVFLIGKDGDSKIKSNSPISSADLFMKIDAMPMRQREVLDKRSSL